IKGFISGTYNGNQMYVVNSAQWNGNKFAIQITANSANDGEDPANACVPVTDQYQVLITIGLEVANSGGIAGLTFRDISMVAGPGGLQEFAIDPLPTHGYYSAPNLFEGEDFQYLYLGRLFSSLYGWSQYGGQVNDVPYLDWSIAVNTGVWDSTASIHGPAVTAKMRIHSLAQLVVNEDAQMNSYDSVEIGNAEGIKILSDASGTGSFIDNGIITYNNNGTAAVERYLEQDEWHGYCVPVESTPAEPFTGLDLLMKWYDEPAHRYRYVVNPAGDSVLDRQMLGYLVYSSSSLNPNSTILTTGMLNTGNLSFPVTSTPAPGGPDGWNLVGNPYPSAVYWPFAGLDETDPVMYVFDPADGNWIFWNSHDFTHSTDAIPIVATQQAFYVHCHAPAPGAGSVSFTNAARVHDNGDFYKNSPAEDYLLILSAYANGLKDEAQIWFSDSATVNFDADHDAYKIWGDPGAPQLYSELPDSADAALDALPWAPGDRIVRMGYHPGPAGIDTIVATNLASFPDTVPVWLRDLKDNSLQDLKLDSVYIFHAAPADAADRFRIIFQDPSLGVPGHPDPSVEIYSCDHVLYVLLPAGRPSGGTVLLYDLAGRQVFTAKLEEAGLNRYVPGLCEGYYLAKVDAPGSTVFKKVFLR
ncbi:MAG TPA: hypothetical protein VMC08_06515, partial [Bacteroidales bacterium]|nr:hypothetical protein [Bacteroidales bacterium]